MLEKVYGQQLSAVAFVQDYIELHFDHLVLTCYIWPELILGDALYGHDHLDFKNKICALIGTDVIRVDEASERVVFNFKSQAKIVLNTSPQNADIVAEIAILRDAVTGDWIVLE